MRTIIITFLLGLSISLQAQTVKDYTVDSIHEGMECSRLFDLEGVEWLIEVRSANELPNFPDDTNAKYTIVEVAHNDKIFAVAAIVVWEQSLGILLSEGLSEEGVRFIETKMKECTPNKRVPVKLKNEYFKGNVLVAGVVKDKE